MKCITNGDLRLVKDNYELIRDKDTLLVCANASGEYTIARMKRDTMFRNWKIREVFMDIDNDIMRGLTYWAEEINRYESLCISTRKKVKK